MSCNNYNVEGNGGASEKTAVTINSSSAGDTVTSNPERRLSIKLTSRWNTIQKNIVTKTKDFFVSTDTVNCTHIPDKYSHIFRHKSRWEHIKLSGAVCGMEFCYAAETAFVTPILLSLGLTIKYVTIIWCLSPLVGLILSPILGSMSDSCQSKYGRRRPFIVLYSIGLILGLILVPSGHHIGVALGDIRRDHASIGNPSRTLTGRTNVFQIDIKTNRTLNHTEMEEFSVIEHDDYIKNNLVNFSQNVEQSISLSNISLESYNDQLLLNDSSTSHIQPWSVAFTVIGVVLLDFSADSCQSPARTYLLDVSIPADHASGLSTFTIMAGLGGSLGYAMGAIDWGKTIIGDLLGGQIHAVFTINTIIFLICLGISLTSFSEIPLPLLKDPKMYQEYQEKLYRNPGDKSGKEMSIISTSQTLKESEKKKHEIVKEKELPIDSYIMNEAHIKKEEYSKNLNENISDKNISCKTLDVSESAEIKITNDMEGAKESPKLKEYLISIIHMPRSLRILSLTNLFGWMSCICYMLYFTDFVGECVFGGDPQDAHDSPKYATFQEGVQFGCWGLALFCISCSFYSLFVEALVKKVGAKAVYIGTQILYSVSTIIMAITRHKVAVIILSPIAGIMYSSLLTIPYLLIADYHSKNQFSKKKKLSPSNARGMGTDVAAVSSMMFLAQLTLSVSMGNVAEAVGSSSVPIFAAALFSACGAVSATQVMYLNI